eukprot:scaffold283527_cov20-Prasinocladus_malaysianus.AAC.1
MGSSIRQFVCADGKQAYTVASKGSQIVKQASAVFILYCPPLVSVCIPPAFEARQYTYGHN